MKKHKEEKDDALVKAGPMDLATRPDFIKAGDTRGTENIGIDDIRPPALKIAQGMSPEVKRTEEAYIEDLREGEFFNTVTRENYGEDAVRFLIVNQLGHRNVEFDADRKVVDFNVPDGDPRTEFREVVEDGKTVRKKPVATKFYDYLILLLHEDRENELMTMSLKSTQLKKATRLNTLIKGAKLPSFAFVIQARPVPEKHPKGVAYGWRFDPAGWPTEAQFNEASEFYDKMKGKNVQVDAEAEHEPGEDPIEDEHVPF